MEPEALDDKITADDLRAERTWLLQHGMKEKTNNAGMSSMAAVRELQKEVEALSCNIDQLEGRADIRTPEIRKGVDLTCLLKADDFGTIFGALDCVPAMERAGYLASCGVGYSLTALGRDARRIQLNKTQP